MVKQNILSILLLSTFLSVSANSDVMHVQNCNMSNAMYLDGSESGLMSGSWGSLVRSGGRGGLESGGSDGVVRGDLGSEGKGGLRSGGSDVVVRGDLGSEGKGGLRSEGRGSDGVVRSGLESGSSDGVMESGGRGGLESGGSDGIVGSGLRSEDDLMSGGSDEVVGSGLESRNGNRIVRSGGRGSLGSGDRGGLGSRGSDGVMSENGLKSGGSDVVVRGDLGSEGKGGLRSESRGSNGVVRSGLESGSSDGVMRSGDRGGLRSSSRGGLVSGGRGGLESGDRGGLRSSSRGGFRSGNSVGSGGVSGMHDASRRTGVARWIAYEKFLGYRDEYARAALAASLTYYDMQSSLQMYKTTNPAVRRDIELLMKTWQQIRFIPANSLEEEQIAACFAYDDVSKIVYIALRGTDSAVDIITDLNASPKAFTDIGNHTYPGYAHGGFIDRANELTPIIMEQLQKFTDKHKIVLSDTKFVFTGHSLGGALAQIMGLQAKHVFSNIDMQVVSFNAPAVFDEELGQYMQDLYDGLQSDDGVFVRGNDELKSGDGGLQSNGGLKSSGGALVRFYRANDPVSQEVVYDQLALKHIGMAVEMPPVPVKTWFEYIVNPNDHSSTENIEQFYNAQYVLPQGFDALKHIAARTLKSGVKTVGQWLYDIFKMRDSNDDVGVESDVRVGVDVRSDVRKVGGEKIDVRSDVRSDVRKIGRGRGDVQADVGVGSDVRSDVRKVGGEKVDVRSDVRKVGRKSRSSGDVGKLSDIIQQELRRIVMNNSTNSTVKSARITDAGMNVGVGVKTIDASITAIKQRFPVNSILDQQMSERIVPIDNVNHAKTRVIAYRGEWMDVQCTKWNGEMFEYYVRMSKLADVV